MENSIEIINDILLLKKPKRLGFWDAPWPETMVRWIREGYKTQISFKKPGDMKWNQINGRWELVDIEGNYLEPIPLYIGLEYDIAPFGITDYGFDIMPWCGYKKVIKETDEWEIIRNGAGADLKWWKNKCGTPEHINFLMKDRQIWEKDFRPFLIEWDKNRLKGLEYFKKELAKAKMAGKFTSFVVPFIWENMRQSMGDITFYESLILDPKWILDYCRVYTDFYKKYLEYIFENDCKPDAVFVCEDLGYNKGLFASPKILEELIFPFYIEINNFFHSKGVYSIMHHCGSVKESLPLIVAADFKALHAMERKAAGNDPFEFAEKYKDKIAFIGGFDVRIFETNDKDLIKKEMIFYINGMKKRGARLIFASDHSVPPTVSYDTYKYIMDIFKEYMQYEPHHLDINKLS